MLRNDVLVSMRLHVVMRATVLQDIRKIRPTMLGPLRSKAQTVAAGKNGNKQTSQEVVATAAHVSLELCSPRWSRDTALPSAR